MTYREAKKIGSRQGLICVIIGIMIAQLIMTSFISLDKGFIEAFFWFAEVGYKLNLFIGILIMLLSGHFYGELAGKAILIKRSNFILVGFLIGMAVLLTTAFFSGWTGFFQEGIDNIGTNDDAFEDYIFKPLFWVLLFGVIPAFIIGIWFGWRIEKHNQSINSTSE